MNASCIDVLTAKLRSLYLVVVCHVRLIRNDKEKICSPLSHLVDQTARPNLVTSNQRTAGDDSILKVHEVVKSYFLQLQVA